MCDLKVRMYLIAKIKEQGLYVLTLKNVEEVRDRYMPGMQIYHVRADIHKCLKEMCEDNVLMIKPGFTYTFLPNADYKYWHI